MLDLNAFVLEVAEVNWMIPTSELGEAANQLMTFVDSQQKSWQL